MGLIFLQTSFVYFFSAFGGWWTYSNVVAQSALIPLKNIYIKMRSSFKESSNWILLYSADGAGSSPRMLYEYLTTSLAEINKCIHWQHIPYASVWDRVIFWSVTKKWKKSSTKRDINKRSAQERALKAKNSAAKVWFTVTLVGFCVWLISIGLSVCRLINFSKFQFITNWICFHSLIFGYFALTSFCQNFLTSFITNW